jgi:hypothetical protein
MGYFKGLRSFAMLGRLSLPLLIIGLCLAGASRLHGVGTAKQTDVPSKEEKELVKVCKQGFDAVMNEIESGRSLPDEKVCVWSRRWLHAQLAVTRKPADAITAYKDHLKRTKEVERIAKIQYKEGKITIVVYTTAQYYRVQAEIWLAKAQSKK